MNAPFFQTGDHGALEALFAEFCDTAERLDIQLDERIAITGLGEATWASCCAGLFDLAPAARARCVRRLHYSLKLLRRMEQNHAAPPARDRPLPAGPHAPGAH